MQKKLILLIALAFFTAGCVSPDVSKRDSDQDGVVDSKDICPNTPSLALVDRFGCARDSDMDGVIDLYDRCPNTKLSQLVNKEGCPVKQ